MRYILVFVLAMVIFPATALSYSEQIIPNNILRIGAEPGSQSSDYREGVDIDIAIIDTGIDYRNHDLNVVDGINCAPEDTQKHPPYIKPYMDWYGHGTAVAGVIAAKNNDFGVVGVAPGARLYAVRAFNDAAESTVAADICAFQYILDHPEIDVVNMSSGWILPPGLLRPITLGDRTRTLGDWIDPRYGMIQKILKRGTIFVAAAGNVPLDVRHMRPANIPGVISVSFFADYDGQPGGWSKPESMCGQQILDDTFFDVPIVNTDGETMSIFGGTRGQGVDISAPGVCILTLGLDNTLVYLTGSSFSAPHVAGVMGLYLSCHDVTMERAIRWLSLSEEPTDDSFLDPDSYPEGVVNARRVC